MRLGLLDFCCIRKKQSPAERVFETIQLAQEAEALGFSRYWLAEHHELAYAHHSAELLATLVAGSTERMRVGVAGMLLRMHSPMRVAKAFRLMAGVFGGRVDLGVGGGIAEDPAVMEAMREGWSRVSNPDEDYAQRVNELLALVRGESPLAFNPLDVHSPPVWLLGSGSPRTAVMAARLGTCYGLSLTHKSSRDDPSLVSRYREGFQPNAHLSQPQWVVSVAGVCAETEQEARRLADASQENPGSNLVLVGTPDYFHERLEEIRHRYQADELIFLDVSADLDARRRAYQMLAERLRLQPLASAA